MSITLILAMDTQPITGMHGLFSMNSFPKLPE